MKQPINKLSIEENSTLFRVCISEKYGWWIDIGYNKTRASAIKAAKRRLQRFIMELERLEE